MLPTELDFHFQTQVESSPIHLTIADHTSYYFQSLQDTPEPFLKPLSIFVAQESFFLGFNNEYFSIILLKLKYAKSGSTSLKKLGTSLKKVDRDIFTTVF